MATELILLEDVANLGQIGDRVRVADGYARNFLIPKNKGVPVSKSALRILEARKAVIQKDHEERLAVAQSMAEKINKDSVTLAVEANEEEKLYGSISAPQIVEALKAKGIEVERHAVLMEEPIHQLGVYNLDIKLHKDVTATLKVWVVRS
ncbi:MAG: 50S ribosomal protein L9 [Lentisphaeria bacterium]|nr:50S ribosomal protein L9 [Lentisphaeria bacterium]